MGTAFPAQIFPPVVCGVTIMLIGINLCGVGIKAWGGGAFCADNYQGLSVPVEDGGCFTFNSTTNAYDPVFNPKTADTSTCYIVSGAQLAWGLLLRTHRGGGGIGNGCPVVLRCAVQMRPASNTRASTHPRPHPLAPTPPPTCRMCPSHAVSSFLGHKHSSLCVHVFCACSLALLLPSTRLRAANNGDVKLPFGSAAYIGLGFAVFSMILVLELFGSPFLRNVEVVVALLVSCARSPGPAWALNWCGRAAVWPPCLSSFMKPSQACRPWRRLAT